MIVFEKFLDSFMQKSMVESESGFELFNRIRI